MNNKPFSPAIAGLIIAGVAVVFSLLANLLGGANEAGLGIFQYLIIIIMLVILVHQFGKKSNYHKTFGELFGYGFKATAIYTLVFICFLVIYLLLNPGIKQELLDAARLEMEKSGNSAADIDKAMAIANNYFYIGVGGSTMFFLVLVGTVGSLLGATITKKIPYQPVDQLDS